MNLKLTYLTILQAKMTLMELSHDFNGDWVGVGVAKLCDSP